MWQWNAVAAMTCFAAMQLLFVQLTRRGVRPAAILLVVFPSPRSATPPMSG